MSRSSLIILLLITPIFLAACLPLTQQSEIQITPSIQLATETATATTEWFPPTATFTPLPTSTLPITPTLDIRPDHGELILSDNFIDEIQWELGTFQDGIIAMGNNKLSLAVKKENGYLSSLRQDTVLENFYAEITASPGICRDEDEYGFLFRATPSNDFYRFSLTCDGQTRVDKLYNGQASSPQPLIMHGSIPPGAPSETRLAVWVYGKEMRFFADDEYLFTIFDQTLNQGSIGVFSRAKGEDDVTISFSDLKVYDSVR